MIKNLLHPLRRNIAGAAMAAALALPATASADVLFTETFDYSAGNLYPQGEWLQSAHKLNPIQVTETKLSFDNFLSGKSIQLNPDQAQDQDVIHACVPRTITDAEANKGTVTGIAEGDIYVGFLINVQNVEAQNYFFSMVSTNYSSALNDGAAPIGNLNTVQLLPSDTPGKFILGIDKASGTFSAPAAVTGDLDLNTTYFVVLHLGIVEGSANDVFEAWINPASTGGDPDLQAPTSKGDLSKGFVGVAISQATGSKKCPEMLVGPIRVTTTWDEIFGAGSEGPDEPNPPSGEAAITVTAPSFSEGFALYQFQEYPAAVTVKASGLTEDITVGGLGGDVTSDVTVIPAAAAMSDGGYKLPVTICDKEGDGVFATLTFTSGETSASTYITVETSPVQTLSSFRAADKVEDWGLYYYAGNARVTYVDKVNNKMYLQDIVGGISVGWEYTYEENAPFKAGDKVKGIYLLALEKSLGIPTFEIMLYNSPDGSFGCGTLVAENDFQTPVEATLADIADAPDMYINRLVTVSDITFTDAGATLTTQGTAVTSGEAAGRVRPFAQTDAVGTVIPESATVTGISTSLSGAIITVRSAADIVVPQEEASIEITRELLVDASEYYPVGVATPFAKLTVKATNMPKATSVWIGGKNRSAFTADVDEIPAGTGEYTINITFKPTGTGRNEAMINFDASPTELSKTLSFSCLAFDPDNLPEFTVDSSTLTPFTAAPGASQEQTVTIHASRLLDYGAVRVLGQGNGAFQIGSTTFLKDGDTQLKVTFAPRTAGNYTEVIEFSTPKAETVTITVTGSTEGERPGEDKQGDELVFDTSNPLVTYSTGFSGCGANNKPLSLEGWKNVAVEGTRAFWAYNEADGNTVAKVTAYDSTVGDVEGSPVKMLLLSPALDYASEGSRLLQFRVKGDFLSDDMDDEFNVLYIDPELPEADRYQVIGGLDIPASAEASGEWREYVVDLDGLDLADTFFIGFEFVSTRGRNNSAVYYIDDFAWGKTDTPFIRVDIKQAVATAKVGEKTLVEEFTVSGMNLTEGIALAFEGADKANFELSHTELPAEGGKFQVHYAPQEIGNHAVYVALTSAGAPASYIIVGGECNGISGIDAIEAAEAEGRTEYYNLRGERVLRPAAGEIYIKVLDGKASKVVK